MLLAIAALQTAVAYKHSEAQRARHRFHIAGRRCIAARQTRNYHSRRTDAADAMRLQHHLAQPRGAAESARRATGIAGVSREETP